MAAILYLTLLLAALWAVCLAEIVNLRNVNSVQDIAHRPSPRASRSFAFPTTDEHSGDPSELLDIVLVASVDGKFHALSRTTGQTLWSMSSFPTAPTAVTIPSALGPLVRTIHSESDFQAADDDNPNELYVIEPQSGDIYVMKNPSDPLQRFPFSMAELVEMSPFSFTSTSDRRLFVGRKETSLLLMELETGRIKATLNSECPWDPFDELQPDEDEIDLDELEDDVPKAQPPTEVFIGRTDYHISIYSGPILRSSVPIQNLSFSTYGPNNQDALLQSSYHRTQDNTYIQSLPSGKVLSFKASNTERGRSSNLLWMQNFRNPVVAVFDVLKKQVAPNTAQAYVLLQPKPGLQDFNPSLTLDTALDRLPYHDSAYIGMVEETGSLFAMSPSHYPFVAFRDGAQHPHIDRTAESPILPSGIDLPMDVDEMTRARKLRELMDRMQQAREEERCADPNMVDRKCFLGVRPLLGGDGEGSESRIRRLLDGPHSDKPLELPQPSAGMPPLLEAPPNATSLPAAPELIRRPDITTSIAYGLALLSLIFFGQRFFSRPKAPTLLSNVDQDSHIVLHRKPIAAALDSIVEGPDVVELSQNGDDIPQQRRQGVTFVVEEDGDESDKNADVESVGVTEAGTPRRRPNRRGKRAKKKKSTPPPEGEADPDDNDDIGKVKPGSLTLEIPTPIANATSTAPAPEVKSSLVVSDTILGFGSHGTVVYRGSLQGRAVAVKRLLQDFVTLASREVSVLQESDDHPNVIRYYYQESQSNFLYIALELCPASLADIIEFPDREAYRDIVTTFDPKKALKEITSGLRHLHALKLVHRDIKPQNILISAPKAGVRGNSRSTTYRMLISDFGLCKKLEVDQTSFLPTAHGAMAAGTVGWRAPEILRGEVKLDDLGDDQSISSSRGSTGTASGSTSGKPTRLTKSVDIFALGCLFYYTLTNGSHPFGDRFEREVNILKDAGNLEGLERFGEEGTEATDLIRRMLDLEASKRPDTATCLLHPYFWDSGKRLNFLQDASDRFEIMCRDPRDYNLVLLETNASNIVGLDWQARLDKTFLETLGKFRKYDGKSVQDLMRALRNKKHHYQDLPDNVKRHVGSMPEGYLTYFTRRYPHLFLHVHRVVSDTSLRTESMFRSYFELAD